MISAVTLPGFGARDNLGDAVGHIWRGRAGDGDGHRDRLHLRAVVPVRRPRLRHPLSAAGLRHLPQLVMTDRFCGVIIIIIIIIIIIYSLKIGAGQQGRIPGTSNCPQYKIKCRNIKYRELQKIRSRSQHGNSANTSSIVIAE